jgi:glycosyltransferase involved in cell wall biosynthesis
MTQRLRVCHVITNLRPGGAQDNTILTARGQESLGLSVAVVAGPYQSRHELLPAAVDYLPVSALQREVSPAMDGIAALQVARALRQWRPDIVHTHLSKAGAIARLVAPSSQRIVHTIHTFPFHPGQPNVINWLYVRLERILANRTDLFLAVAAANVRKSLANGIGRPDQYRVVPSGINTRRVRELARVNRAIVRRSLGLNEHTSLVGTVGRFVPQKNPMCFVDAARLLQDRWPELTFCAVGGGPLLAECVDRAKELGLHNIAFVGEQEDAFRWIRAFDVFVHTSLYEGMGRVLGEAMLLDTPIVATAVDGVVDAIGEDWERGITVPPRNASAIAESVSEILTDPERAAEMCERGATWALEQLSLERMIEGVMNAYREIWPRQRDSRRKDLLPK